MINFVLLIVVLLNITFVYTQSEQELHSCSKEDSNKLTTVVSQYCHWITMQS